MNSKIAIFICLLLVLIWINVYSGVSAPQRVQQPRRISSLVSHGDKLLAIDNYGLVYAVGFVNRDGVEDAMVHLYPMTVVLEQ